MYREMRFWFCLKPVTTNILALALLLYQFAIKAVSTSILGSGKTFTMMGSHDQNGLIPRLCGELFDRISQVSTV